MSDTVWPNVLLKFAAQVETDSKEPHLTLWHTRLICPFPLRVFMVKLASFLFFSSSSDELLYFKSKVIFPKGIVRHVC